MIWKKSISSLILVGLAVMVVGMCSKLKQKQPTQPSTNKAQPHPVGWLDTLSSDFHGKYIREHNWDLQSCQKCHGDDYAGGASRSSCNNSSCHSSTPEACTTCHGGRDNDTGAPPKDINDHVQTRFKGVGAHTAHVNNVQKGYAFDCSECHKKPTKLEDKGHVDDDLPAEITWGDFAKLDNLSPVWADSTCTNVYCHGASLSDGILTNPVWTQADTLLCNACHGLAPKTGAHEKHVKNSQLDCNICHDGYVKNSTVDQNLHIDGKRDVKLNATVGGSYANGVCSNVSCHGSGDSPAWVGGTLSCTSCHGGTDNNTGAPPIDLLGNTSNTVRGVGAHTAHVGNSQWGRAYDCLECHTKPTQISDVGHSDSDPPAELEWGTLSQTENQTPNWDGTTCRDVYCHGGSLSDGILTNPVWTQTEALTCDGCHGIAPKTGAHEKHVETNNQDCNVCHDGYVKNSTVDQNLHIDGKRDVKLNATVGGSYANGVCSNVSCHGSGDSPAWVGGTLSCTSCHGGTDNNTGAPPVDLLGNTSNTVRGVGAHTAHVGNSQWGRAYDCLECHIKPAQVSDVGHSDSDPPAEIAWGTLSQTESLAPSWDGTTCRDVYCHGGSLSGGILTNPVWTQTEALTCNGCHGLAPRTGAHEKHVETNNQDCNVCHDGYLKNSTVDQNLHIDGKRDVQLNATVGGSYANGVCSNVSCHGSGDSPAWVGGTLSCTSCHGGTDNNTGAPPVDLQGNTSNTVRGVGAHTAHVGNSQWGRAYDCLECHVKPAQVSDVGHSDSDPPAEIVWGILSQTENLAPSWDGTTCSDVYCHGGSLSDGILTNPVWTQTAALTCNGCHGIAPKTGAHEKHVEANNQDCNVCHDGYLKNSTVDQNLHIDGKRDVKLNATVGGSYGNGICSNVSCHGSGDSPAWVGGTLSCTSCHGGTDNETGAPPVDLQGNTSNTTRGVGAHTAHVGTSQWARVYDCNECHIKPTQVSDVGHSDTNPPAEIVWGTLSQTENLAPNWDGTTCSDVYCHGGSLSNGVLNSPTWTQAQALTCDACHGLPPATGSHVKHTQDYQFDCNICHDGYLKNTAVVQSIHVDGNKDVTLSAAVGGSYSNGVCSNVICHGSGDTPLWSTGGGLACISCHGGQDNSSGAPPLDLSGNLATNFKGVGAHTAHISGGTVSNGFACTECHLVPTLTNDPGHIGIELLPAEITWGSLAKLDSALCSWNGVQTCENIYCHGEFALGNKDNNPIWTLVDGSQDSCGTCHALPPVAPHPQLTQCSNCHGSVVDASMNIIDKDKHINGQKDFN